jgi:hypothetical protein
MSLKTSLIKIAIKLTPNIIVIWVANIILKGIAELTDFNFDLDTRTAFVRATLLGEAEPIEVAIDGFAVVSDADAHQLIIHQAQSNRLWLDHLLSRVVGKAWKIPEIPEYADEIELLAELFKPDSPEQEESGD